MGAGILSVETENEFMRAEINKFRLFLHWTATAGGVVTWGITQAYRDGHPGTSSPVRIVGRIVMIETIPGLAGDRVTACPTAAYDICLLDTYGLDITAGYLEDRSDTIAERVVPTQPLSVHGEVTLSITNAGNATSGMVIIWFE